MEITKTTEKYDFYQEGVDYILDLGDIKRNENRTTELFITGIEDSNLLTLAPRCGCTATDRVLIDKNSLSVKVNYKDCDPSFTKVVEIKYKNVKTGIIKIKGKCN